MNLYRLLFLLININTSFALDTVRVDKHLIEPFSAFIHKYELIITDNCLNCIKQLELMKDCVNEDDVVLSKISDFKGVTPVMWVNTTKGQKFYVGVFFC